MCHENKKVKSHDDWPSFYWSGIDLTITPVIGSWGGKPIKNICFNFWPNSVTTISPRCIETKLFETTIHVTSFIVFHSKVTVICSS